MSNLYRGPLHGCFLPISVHLAKRFPEMQLIVGPVGPRGQNFRGSGKWRLCVRPNDRQTFLLLGAVKKLISVGPGYLLDPLSDDGSLIIVNKVKSRKQIGKHFCSFLFMLNFRNQFPFRILFFILSVIVVNCTLIISVMAAWTINNLPYRVVGPCRLSISVSVSILQDSCKILIYSRFCF
jgi:hypothetical protein